MPTMKNKAMLIKISYLQMVQPKNRFELVRQRVNIHICMLIMVWIWRPNVHRNQVRIVLGKIIFGWCWGMD